MALSAWLEGPRVLYLRRIPQPERHPVESGELRHEVDRSNTKVLIISHTFPPEPGIGGRRWAKFAKYLHLAGVEVYVLTRKHSTIGTESLWTRDVSGIKDRVFTYRAPYPNALWKTDLNLIDKLKYKVSLRLVSALAKGNPYDRTVFAQNELMDLVERITEEYGIGNVIASGPPFGILYYTALLKRRGAHFKLIADFRDGWTWDKRFGISIISEQRRRLEQERLRFVVESADAVITPAEFHLANLRALYPSAAEKMSIVPHGFDPEDLPSVNERLNKGDHYIYGGTLYDRLETVFQALNRSFRAIHPKTVEIRLHLSNPAKLEEYLVHIDKEFHSYFVRKPLLPPRTFYREVSAARAFVFFSGVPIKITSKVYEILSCDTPILTLGLAGDLSDYLEQHGLGVHFEADDFCFSKADQQIAQLDGFGKDNDFPDFARLSNELIQLFD